MLDKKTKQLLPKLMIDAIDAISQSSNAPDELTLPLVLSVANYAVQALADVDPGLKGWNRCAISMYCTVLATSGAQKTSTLLPLMVGMRKYERSREAVAEQDQTDFEIEEERYKKSIKEEVKSPTFVKVKKPIRPRGFRHILEKGTVNGMINTLDRVPFLGLFSSDAGEFFNSHSFQDKSKAIEMIATLSKAWSGEDIDKVTGVEDMKIHDRRFNMLVMLQQELAGFLNNSQYKDQGFINRILITQAGFFRKKGIDLELEDDSPELSELLEEFNDRVYTLLLKVDEQQEKIKNAPPPSLPGKKATWVEVRARQQALDAKGKGNPNELILPKIGFRKDDNTRKIMSKFYNEMADSYTKPEYKEYENFMSRAYEHCCRLAATMCLFDNGEYITEANAECAVGLMRYFINQRLNLNVDGEVRERESVVCADAFIKWLKTEPDMKTTKGNAVKFGPNIYRKMDVEGRVKVMEELMSRESIELEEIINDETNRKSVIISVKGSR